MGTHSEFLLMVGRQVLSFLSLMQEEKSILAFCATDFTCFTFLPRKMSERNLCFPLNKLTGAGIMQLLVRQKRRDDNRTLWKSFLFFCFNFVF